MSNDFFTKNLLDWYKIYKRDLPWRTTREPYLIWISEIILQQTRVAQGLPYYNAFIEKFPTLNALANASEDEVLKAWQGLGYYSRARNLHFAAQTIRDRYHGVFPTDFKHILALKGIGVYTASAIASFAFDQSHAVVDGNVYRVLSRFFDITLPIDSTLGKKYFEELALHLLPDKNPAIYNQAIMEFGALQCVPNNPNCAICPLRLDCLAFKNGTVNLRPVKNKKLKIRHRFFYYLACLNDSDQILLNKRLNEDIWKGLYEFPLFESEKYLQSNELVQWLPITSKFKFVIETYQHQLTHQHLTVSFIFTHSNETFNELLQQNHDYLSVRQDDLADYAFPKVIESFLKKKALLD